MTEVELDPVAVVPVPAVIRVMLPGDAGIGWLPDFHAIDAVADDSLVRLLPEWSQGASRRTHFPPAIAASRPKCGCSSMA